MWRLIAVGTLGLVLTGVVPMANGQEKPVSKDTPADSEVEKWKTETARFEAEKAAWDAKLAALRAQIGEVPDSGYSGDVTVGAKAGETEAALLAAKAVDEAAEKIAKEILGKANCQATQQKILLYAAAQMPDFQAYVTFNTQLSMVETVLEKALTERVERAEISPAAIGLALSAANKILGYFRTDYAAAGVAMTSQDDSMLVHALAGKVAKSGCEVQLPAIYNPAVHSAPTLSIIDQLVSLAEKRQRLQSESERHRAEAKTAVGNKKMHLAAASTLDAAAALYDAFFSKLTPPAGDGKIPLSDVLLETALIEILKKPDGWLLIVKIQKAGGAHYTKKNIGTLFGGMPFYHMGGVVVSFVLLNGANGSVEKSGVVPIHGGFVKANKVETYLKPSRVSRRQAEEGR